MCIARKMELRKEAYRKGGDVKGCAIMDCYIADVKKIEEQNKYLLQTLSEIIGIIRNARVGIAGSIVLHSDLSFNKNKIDKIYSQIMEYKNGSVI